MTDDEFSEIMNKIAEASPDKMSTGLLTAIIANLVRVYDLQEHWPSIMMAVTQSLSELMVEEVLCSERDAERDANNFLKAVMDKHYE
tara:strand:+ start:104 stop:364 length:261 start_codon:yes stop_codon:yes gene_type:complete